MSKSRKALKENSADIEVLKQLEDHWFSITEASIKDDFCTYSYEITKGVGLGRTHKVEGKNSGSIIDDDMRTAFSKFNVHMAAIDDVFKHSGIEIENIDDEHGHELTGLFHVTGFKIKGGKDNESIELIGNKYVSGGGRFDLTSPKTPLDNLSSYAWFKELKQVVNKARLEVQLYDGGKYTKAAEEEEVPEAKTGNLFNGAASDGEDGKASPKDLMKDFDEAKL